ncbi:hypothetical protein T492DRAFT_987812 [Pavlovales sp. CCMP2436]|nr:hypothetical protein T492DRAFT_987812 [Pavlovales sp. CCMP2436]
MAQPPRETRWAIVGAGLISADFAVALELTPGARVIAVAARLLSKAKAFAAKHGIPVAYEGYEELARDPNVDIVYIGVVHPVHYECAKLMLAAGKAVLCEKPMCMNARECASLIALAKANNCFLMEGMWSRFFPATEKALELIRQGAIGDVVECIADFGFASKVSEASRLYSLELGGGGLLDIGIYVLAAAAFIWGCRPSEVRALGWRESTGADSCGVIALKYGSERNAAAMLASLLGEPRQPQPQPRIASLTYSMRSLTREQTVYQGTLGKISLWPAHCPTHLTLEVDGAPSRTLEFALPELPRRLPRTQYLNSVGFVYQAQRVQQLLAEGAKECPEWSLQTSLDMARLMDGIRAQLGVVYPRHDGLLLRARALLGVWPLSAKLFAVLTILLALTRKRGRPV